MFERFTRDARAVVSDAVGEAQRRRDRHVGTEHLLLGVIASANPVTAPVLDAAGIDLQQARQALDAGDIAALAAVGVDVRAMQASAPDPDWRRSFGRRRRSPGHLPFTGGAKQTLEQALRHAVRRSDRHIGTEHMLLALTDRPAPDAAHHLLAALDVDVVALRAALERRLQDAA
jgi:ATP-dependent Clp protease ATP-binding subunit ClpA